jgi:hypothetical protein
MLGRSRDDSFRHTWELGHGADLPNFDDADGKTHYIEGVGFAIVRDTANFLATASADSTGQATRLPAYSPSPNPQKGNAQQRRCLNALMRHTPASCFRSIRVALHSLPADL